MKRLALVLGLLLVTALPASAARLSGPLGLHPMWKDGLGEYSTYTGSLRGPGGAKIAVEATLTVTRQEFDRVRLARTAKPRNARFNFPALELYGTLSAATGACPTRAAWTSALDATDGHVVRFTATAGDSNGVFFADAKLEGKSLVCRTYSGSADAGDGDSRLPNAAGVVPEDALPLWIRSAGVELDTVYEVRILPSQLEPGAFGKPEPASVRVMPDEGIEVPAGKMRARRVEVTRAGSVDVYLFDLAFPHVMLRMQRHDGRVLELTRTRRFAFWKAAAAP